VADVGFLGFDRVDCRYLVVRFEFALEGEYVVVNRPRLASELRMETDLSGVYLWNDEAHVCWLLPVRDNPEHDRWNVEFLLGIQLVDRNPPAGYGHLLAM